MQNTEWEPPPTYLSEPSLFPTPRVGPETNITTNNDTGTTTASAASKQSKCSGKMKRYIFFGILITTAIGGIDLLLNYFYCI